MTSINEAVFWINRETGEVRVKPHSWGAPELYRDDPRWRGHWSDPIGAAYSQWHKMKDGDRIRLMLETAIDLAMQGVPLENVLRAFFEIREFRALGSESYPMCRALTKAVIGKSLEPNTMSFEELLVAYKDRA